MKNNLKNEDNLRNQDNFKNEDDLSKQPENEDNFKNEENLGKPSKKNFKTLDIVQSPDDPPPQHWSLEHREVILNS